MFALASLSNPYPPPTPTSEKVARTLILQTACEYLQQCSWRSHRGLLEGMVWASHNLSTRSPVPLTTASWKGERGSKLQGSRHPNFRQILTAVALQHRAERSLPCLKMFSKILIIKWIHICDYVKLYQKRTTCHVSLNYWENLKIS